MNNSLLTWIAPDDPPEAFPDPALALREPDGLLAAGGDLSVDRLLAAYRGGIFPWYEDGQPILWWCPDPRCIIRPGDFHISKRLLREMRASSLELRVNTAFGDVVQACAAPRNTQQGTWITNEMRIAYEQLNDAGWAHSIEIWDGHALVGGVYGLIIGRVFFGESMFSAKPNTSKMALAGLARRTIAKNLELIDCQLVSRHLMSLGARTCPRAEFIALLDRACYPASPWADWPRAPIPVAAIA